MTILCFVNKVKGPYKSLLLKNIYCALDSECCCAIAEINFLDETLREDSSQGDNIQEVIRCDLI